MKAWGLGKLSILLGVLVLVIVVGAAVQEAFERASRGSPWGAKSSSGRTGTTKTHW
jgi:hypothetical protein